MISQPHTLDAVRPHLRNIFTSLSDLQIQGTGRPLEEQLAIEFEESQKKMQSSAHTMVGLVLGFFQNMFWLNVYFFTF